MDGETDRFASMKLAQLRELVPSNMRNQRKGDLIVYLQQQEQRAIRKKNWEDQVFLRGHVSCLQLINRLRTAMEWEPIPDILPATADYNPLEASLAADETFEVWASPSLLRILENDIPVAEGLQDVWGYEFAVRLLRGQYSEWQNRDIL